MITPEVGESQHVFGRFDLLEVAGHVGGQDHVDHQRAEFAELFPRQIGQDVAILFTHQPLIVSNNTRSTDRVKRIWTTDRKVKDKNKTKIKTKRT